MSLPELGGITQIDKDALPGIDHINRLLRRQRRARFAGLVHDQQRNNHQQRGRQHPLLYEKFEK